jgi:tetraacyldisaccharide 4'-kinase
MGLRDWLLAAWFAPQRLSLPSTVLWKAFCVLATPLTWVTQSVSARKVHQIQSGARAQAHPPIVIVVGNLVVGGAGKTPIVIALVEALQAAELATGVIARGYKAAQQKDQTASFLGDEARLVHLRTGAPVVTHPARRLALERICQEHPNLQVVVSDDGLQHAALPRDIEWVVIDGRGLGNGKLLPLGPLRESESRLKLVDALVFSNGANAQTANIKDIDLVPQFTSELQVLGFRQPGQADNVITVQEFAAMMGGQKLCALAGIASPDNFFSMTIDLLANREIRLTRNACLALPDHAPISNELLAQHMARHQASILLMTEKDVVKCDPSWPQAQHCWALVIRAQLPAELTESTIHRIHQLLGHPSNGPAPT